MLNKMYDFSWIEHRKAVTLQPTGYEIIITIKHENPKCSISYISRYLCGL